MTEKKHNRDKDGWCTECGVRRGELTPAWDCDCDAEFPLTKLEMLKTYETSPVGVYHQFFDDNGVENRPYKGLK